MATFSERDGRKSVDLIPYRSWLVLIPKGLFMKKIRDRLKSTLERSPLLKLIIIKLIINRCQSDRFSAQRNLKAIAWI